MSILLVILVLALLIFFHELGHFLAARSMGIGVSKFSLGFGPKLFGKKWGKTYYQVAVIPLGGYVKLVGESGTDEELPEGFVESESYDLKSAWQRMIVIFAGPLANLLLAWLIFWGLFWVHGQAVLLPDIGQVVENSPAEQAGLKSGDRILSIDNVPIGTWEKVVELIQASNGAEVLLAVNRGTEVLEFKIIPKQQVQKNIFGEDISSWMLGISFSGANRIEPIGFLTASHEGFVKTFYLIKITCQSLVKLIERVIPLDNVGGPIMIAQMVSEQSKQGLENVLALTALISINLGILNLLPIPVLDGGHLVFLGFELIFRRRVPVVVQEATTRVGIILLLALMGFAIFNDVMRIFS